MDLALQAFEPVLTLGAGLDDYGSIRLAIERHLPPGPEVGEMAVM